MPDCLTRQRCSLHWLTLAIFRLFHSSPGTCAAGHEGAGGRSWDSGESPILHFGEMSRKSPQFLRKKRSIDIRSFGSIQAIRARRRKNTVRSLERTEAVVIRCGSSRQRDAGLHGSWEPFSHFEGGWFDLCLQTQYKWPTYLRAPAAIRTKPMHNSRLRQRRSRRFHFTIL